MGPAGALVLVLGLVLTSPPERANPSLAYVLGLADLCREIGAQPEECAPPPHAYSAKPIRGIVVDRGTGAPLEGVFVVAQWVLHEPGKGHWRRLHVVETTTDATGSYLVLGWGPKRNPLAPWTRLLTRDPGLSFFKRGYKPLGVENRFVRNDAMRISEWDGKTVRLEKFAGTPEEWAKEIGFLQTDLGWVDVMEWRRVPKMTLAILEELERIPRRLRASMASPASLGTSLEEVRRFVEGQK